MSKDPLMEQFRVTLTHPDFKLEAGHYETWEKVLGTILLLVPLGVGLWMLGPFYESLFDFVRGRGFSPVKISRTLVGFFLFIGSEYMIERLYHRGWLLMSFRRRMANVIPFPRRPNR